MKYNYDITVVIPTVRPELADKAVLLINNSLHEAELRPQIITVGPTAVHSALISEHIIDEGSPSRAFMKGASIAEGEYITLAVDDITEVRNLGSLYKSLKSTYDTDTTLENVRHKDILALPYIEGINLEGGFERKRFFGPEYWIAWTHADLRQPGVDKNWYQAAFTLMRTDYFKYLGGIDCKFNHINFNVHDLHFRAQKNGSRVFFPPPELAGKVNDDFWVYHALFDDTRTKESSPVLNTYEWDKNLFIELYKDNLRPVKIDFDNWRDADARWQK